MSASYSRSPTVAWLLAAFTLGLGMVWLVWRFANDLNKIVGSTVIDARAYASTFGLLLAIHITNVIVLAGLDINPGAAGNGPLRVWIFAIAFLTLGSLFASLIAINCQLNKAISEPSGLASAAFTVGITLLAFASFPYLQHRLNLLARGGTSENAEGAPA